MYRYAKVEGSTPLGTIVLLLRSDSRATTMLRRGGVSKLSRSDEVECSAFAAGQDHSGKWAARMSSGSSSAVVVIGAHPGWPMANGRYC